MLLQTQGALANGRTVLIADPSFWRWGTYVRVITELGGTVVQADNLRETQAAFKKGQDIRAIISEAKLPLDISDHVATDQRNAEILADDVLAVGFAGPLIVLTDNLPDSLRGDLDSPRLKYAAWLALVNSIQGYLLPELFQ